MNVLSKHSPVPRSAEGLILTRLFAAQRRLRFVRSCRAALFWFALGSAGASVLLLLVWNWNYLPGPWQWLASAGRPREILWLPLLTGLGGFASHWFVLPNPRQSAYRIDRLLDSHERLLTAVDWILSEKPRTETSERLLGQASVLVSDEAAFAKQLRKLEKISSRKWSLLLTIALPVLLLVYLPANVPLPPSASVWLGESQVDKLTEDLLQELEEAQDLSKMDEKLEKLLKELENIDPSKELTEEQKDAQRDLQRMVDQMNQQAETQEKARELLETLAQRAREGQTMSEEDKKALEALRKQLTDRRQQNELEQARQDWEKGDFKEAAKGMESLQKEMGESSQSLSQKAQEKAAEGGLEGEGGQEFNEGQGDQFNPDGTPKNGSAQGKGKGQGKSVAVGEGEGGEAEGEGLPMPGKGTTLEEEGAPNAQGIQSLRRSDKQSDWMEEYKNLHAPERADYQKGQTRVKGQMGDDGPRFKTSKEGLGDVTEPSDRQGSGGVLQYQQEAENAILREEVPADYRDNVRSYFEALDRGR